MFKLEFNEVVSISAQHDHKRPILVSVHAEKLDDWDADVSYLEDGEHEDDAKRLAEYGETWWCVGVKLFATIAIPSHDGKSFHTQELSSAGLWGIESDADASHFSYVANDEWRELDRELDMLNVVYPENVSISFK